MPKWTLTIGIAHRTGRFRDAGGDETADNIESGPCLGIVVPPRPPVDETEILHYNCVLKLEGTDADRGPRFLLWLNPKAMTAKEETLLITRIGGGLVEFCDTTGEGGLVSTGVEVVSRDTNAAGPPSYGPAPTEGDTGECVLSVDVSLTLLFHG